MARLTRRQLSTGVLTGAVSFYFRKQGSAARLLDEPQTISKHPELYHGWPTLARRSNGDLLLAWSGGREEHVCPFGRVELMVSKDEGRSWSWPQVLMDSSIDDRDAGILETGTGSLLVTTFTSLAYEPILERAEKQNWPADKLRRWQSVQSRLSSSERKAHLGCWMLRSVDGGITWSAPYRVPMNSPHGPVAVSDGRVLYAGKDLWGGGAVGVCESKDDGQSWRWLSKMPVRVGDNVKEYHELHMVEVSKGRLIAHIRNHNPENRNETLQSESKDGGASWSTPHSIGVWGLPSHLLRLRDQRLVMTYGYRREPFGNQARVSDDGGRTWSDAVTLSSDGVSGDLGYSSSVELADGSLLTAWYEKLRTSSKAVLRQVRWRLG